MVYRNSWLAGLAGLVFAFVKLNALILPTANGVAWQYIVVAALVLGIVVTWTALTYRLKTWIVVLINAAAATVAVVRVAAPESTKFLLPTASSFSIIRDQLKEAQLLIRIGVEPVVPEAGVVVIVMVVLWTAGALLSWGLLRGHPYVALLPPLILSLQFATMARVPTGPATVAAFVALVALIIFAITSDDRDQTAGRMAPRGRWAPRRHRPPPVAAALLGVTIAGSVFAVDALATAVPGDGILDWRVDGGSVSTDAYGGSDSYNPFIGIHQRLVNGGETVRFMASIASDVPANEVYFQFVTMETYDGERFYADYSNDVGPLEEPTWQLPGHSFAGPTTELAARVAIDQLRQGWLPVPAVPWRVEAKSHDFGPYLRVRPEDGAILYQGGSTSPGMEYRVDARIPQPDPNVLATKPGTTELSIAFRNALDDDELDDSEVPEAAFAEVRLEPPNASRFLELPPADHPTARIPAITVQAEEITADLETAFEKGLALEAWLRSFDYTTNILPDQGAVSLAAWLLDEDSPNYHRGYCENFATAMGVMARTLGIHSRVVLGFTPGEPNVFQSGVVIVRDRNAHAWVELWMPTQGWVRFDPTPRPDSINPSTMALVEDQLEFPLAPYLDVELPEQLPGDAGSAGVFPDLSEFDELFAGGGGSGEVVAPPFEFPSWVRWAVPALIVLAMLAAGVPGLKKLRRRRRLHRLGDGDIAAAWEDIVARLSDLGRPARGTHTPSEVAESVAEVMQPLAAVYTRVVYGPPNDAEREGDVQIAEVSLAGTREHLKTVTSRRDRILAPYRPGSMFVRYRRPRRRSGR